MSLSLIEWRELHEIGKKVRRTDPRLASALTLFALLASGEPMPRHERLPACGWRLRAVPLFAAAAAGLVAGRAVAIARRIFARAGRGSRT
jgi:hypothetical protein